MHIFLWPSLVMSSEWLMLSKHSYLLYNFEANRKHRLSALICIFLGEEKMVDAEHGDKALLMKSQKQVEGISMCFLISMSKHMSRS